MTCRRPWCGKPWEELYNCICIDGQAVTIMYLLGGSLFIYKDLSVIKGDENGIIDTCVYVD